MVPLKVRFVVTGLFIPSRLFAHYCSPVKLKGRINGAEMSRNLFSDERFSKNTGIPYFRLYILSISNL